MQILNDQSATRWLDGWLTGVDPEAFLANQFLQSPMASAGGCVGVCERFEERSIADMLAAAGVDALLVGREGLWEEGRAPTVAEYSELRTAGYTLRIRHGERHDPLLAQIATAFARDFRARVDCHLYDTPAGHPGLNWHYDAEDVFILQLRGDKEWWLRKNTVHPWPVVETMPADLQYEREIMPVMRCRLAAGDWLYIPSGFWHRTLAGGDSLSLSVGLLTATALDVLDFIRKRLIHDLRWRQRLPLASASSADGESLRPLLRSLFADLGRDLGAFANDAVLDEFLRFS